MSASGGRRIKRSISIDATSIHFLDEDERQRLHKAHLLKPYLTTRHQEIDAWNQQLDAPESVLNHRQMTNIGTFRAYLNEYLRHHPRIRKDMTLMVRQLAPDDHGLPIEIYAFTNTVVWLNMKVFRLISSTISLPWSKSLACAFISRLPETIFAHCLAHFSVNLQNR